MTKPYKLFLDDLRTPIETYGSFGKDMIVARSTHEAKLIVQEHGIMSFLALDHDLGANDRAMDFLKWLANEYWDGEQSVPGYEVHSANPEGKKNLCSFMDSWRKSHAEKPL